MPGVSVLDLHLVQSICVTADESGAPILWLTNPHEHPSQPWLGFYSVLERARTIHRVENLKCGNDHILFHWYGYTLSNINLIMSPNPANVIPVIFLVIPNIILHQNGNRRESLRAAVQHSDFFLLNQLCSNHHSFSATTAWTLFPFDYLPVLFVIFSIIRLKVSKSALTPGTTRSWTV